MSRTATLVNAFRFSLHSTDGACYDQIAKFGDFVKDGDEVSFNEITLQQMVENFKTNPDLAADYDHQALQVAINGQPAPALAFYDSLALVRDGQLLSFATHKPDRVTAPQVTGWGSGLYARRYEVTPLGKDLLPNYKYISPAFVTEGKNEQGQDVGYQLLNIAWTNVPFLAGMEPITYHRLGAPLRMDAGIDAALVSKGDRVQVDGDQFHPGDVGTVISIDPQMGTMEILWDSDKTIRTMRTTVLSDPRWHLVQSKVPTTEGNPAAPDASSTVTVNVELKGATGASKKYAKGKHMDAEMMKRLGLDDGADDAAVQAAMKKYMKKMEDDQAVLEKKCDDLEAKMKKMDDGDDDEDDKKMDSLEEDRKSATPMDDKAEADDAEQMDDAADQKDDDGAALKKMRKLVGLSNKAPLSRVLDTLEARFVPMSELAKVRRELEVIKRERDEEKRMSKDKAVESFVSEAVRMGRYPAEKADKLKKLATRDMDAAKDALFEAHTFGALKRFSSGGRVLGASTHPETDLTASAPEVGSSGLPELDRAASKRAEVIATERKIAFHEALMAVAKEEPHLFQRSIKVG